MTGFTPTELVSVVRCVIRGATGMIVRRSFGRVSQSTRVVRSFWVTAVFVLPRGLGFIWRLLCPAFIVYHPLGKNICTLQCVRCNSLVLSCQADSAVSVTGAEVARHGGSGKGRIAIYTPEVASGIEFAAVLIPTPACLPLPSRIRYHGSLLSFSPHTYFRIPILQLLNLQFSASHSATGTSAFHDCSRSRVHFVLQDNVGNGQGGDGALDAQASPIPRG